MSFSDAVKKIEATIKDLSSLHVRTYTGSVEVDLSQADTATLRSDLVKQAVKTATTPAAGDAGGAAADAESGKLTLVAEAFYQFDGDSYNFLTSKDVPAQALEMHTEAVKAGIATRKGLVELVKGVI